MQIEVERAVVLGVLELADAVPVDARAIMSREQSNAPLSV